MIIENKNLKMQIIIKLNILIIQIIKILLMREFLKKPLKNYLLLKIIINLNQII